MLTENQKRFIMSLSPLSVCTEIGSFLFSDLKGIISNNSTKSYKFLLVMDKYTYGLGQSESVTLKWLTYTLEYSRRSLNYIITTKTPRESDIIPSFLLKGACIGIFEAIQHSYMYCKPHIMQSEDPTTSSSVFLNSKPDAIINLDISLGSTLLTYSFLNEDGLTQQILNHDDLIADK
ncbi:hypothetical protein EDC94DRAFT_127399 [Helicostylum pulchrum]|nr:hypothetical protein EDC94DRAFT_127399 [Helicostylum pulchrum]